MSEALSSTEIEDVLSSIRRLVSDDLRPTSRPAVAGQAQLAGDKLILTPALRVVAPVTPLAAQPPMFVPYPRHDPIADVAGPDPVRRQGEGPEQVGLDQVVASLGAAVDAQSTEWEAETGDVSPEFAEHLPVDAWNLPQIDTTQIDITQPDITQPGAAQPDTTQPGAAQPETAALAEASPLAAGLGTAQNFVFSSGGDVEEVILATAATPDPIPGWAQQDDSAAQDGDDAVYVSPTPYGTLEPDPAWADAAEASVIAALSSEAPPLPEQGAASLQPEDEAMLFNEDVLRELVRDILREELAGKMGERITRNIRKLVRAEIARSLAAQEYE